MKQKHSWIKTVLHTYSWSTVWCNDIKHHLYAAGLMFSNSGNVSRCGIPNEAVRQSWRGEVRFSSVSAAVVWHLVVNESADESGAWTSGAAGRSVMQIRQRKGHKRFLLRHHQTLSQGQLRCITYGTSLNNTEWTKQWATLTSDEKVRPFNEQMETEAAKESRY